MLKEASDTAKQFTGDLLDFYNFHIVQLLGSKFPVDLIKQLREKLTSDAYDAGDYFKIMDNQDLGSFEVHSLKDIKK